MRMRASIRGMVKVELLRKKNMRLKKFVSILLLCLYSLSNGCNLFALAPDTATDEIGAAELWWASKPPELRDLKVGVLFRNQAERYGEKTMMSVRRDSEYRNFSWREAYKTTREIALGLLNNYGEDVSVLALSLNCPEMAFLDYACVSAGIPYVPVNTEYSEVELTQVLKDFKPKVIVAYDKEHLEMLWNVVGRLETIPAIVMIDQTYGEADGRAVRFSDIQAAGARNLKGLDFEKIAESVTGDKVITWLYTSGSSGTPKGSGFTQKNILSKRVARAEAVPAIGDGDVFLCYLPLYHTFGRWFELYGTLYWGNQYVFADLRAGNKSRTGLIIEQLREVRPSVFISVPIIWKHILEETKKELGAKAQTPEVLSSALLEKTGGRIKFSLSGGGALDDDVFNAFNSAGVPISSGFGMTEATGGISMTLAGETVVSGSVGNPLPGIEIRLDPSALDGAGDHEGELLIRGPYVSRQYRDGSGKGYTPDGWFRTGDIAQYDEGGDLKITGRIKDIIKLSSGRTVSPNNFESMAGRSRVIKHVCVVGDKMQYPVALVQPDRELIKNIFNLAEVEYNRQTVYQLIAYIVREVNSSLPKYERVRNFRILTEMDPSVFTQKSTLKRKAVVKRYETQIRQMYEEGIAAELPEASAEEPSAIIDLESIVKNSVYKGSSIETILKNLTDLRYKLTTKNLGFNVQQSDDMEKVFGLIAQVENAVIDTGANYRDLRRELTFWCLYCEEDEIKAIAQNARRRLRSRMHDFLACGYYEGLTKTSDSRENLLIDFKDPPEASHLMFISQGHKDRFRNALNDTLLIPEIIWQLSGKVINRGSIAKIEVEKISVSIFQENYRVVVFWEESKQAAFNLVYGRKDFYDKIYGEGAFDQRLESMQEKQMETLAAAEGCGGESITGESVDNARRRYGTYGGYWRRFNLWTTDFNVGVDDESARYLEPALSV